ncbi:MAG TPA: glycosyltransferase [Trinickia sp.]|uniref:glycosyltransferase n=1 Tax=Trinickia sp. TaxID=2571163 RepID=UPI002C63CED0|nr:glycosyltransferase [Trinickia sp.]HVW52325.1 glycosyltransferase [Trinickia sp.]
MKVVFFVHYFPPLNSTGSRRVESFAKYLARDGHEIVVISTRKTRRDGPLTETVPSYVRLYELDASGRCIGTQTPGESAVVTQPAAKRIHWTRRVRQQIMRLFGQLIDHRLLFAMALGSKKLDPRVSQELATADVFVSSCPPWPTHLAALVAARRFGKPWIADYRDQFSGNHVMNGTWFSDRIECAIDRALLKRATAVTVISGPMQTYYEDMHAVVHCVENGYDSELFDSVSATLQPAASSSADAPIVVRYMGTITRDRIPHNLLAALERVNTRGKSTRQVRLEFFGDTRILEDFVSARHPNVKQWIDFRPAVPYRKSIEAMLTADALLFMETSSMSSLSARGVLTTKLFEYLASGRPIVADIDDATLAASYIKRASASHVVSRDVETLASALERLGAGEAVAAHDHDFVTGLSRREKARQFEQIALGVSAGSA